MKHLLSLVVLALIGVVTSFGLVAKSQNMESLTPEQWRQDIAYFKQELPKQHISFFKKQDQQAFNKSVEQLEQKVASLKPNEVVVELARLVSLAVDGHSFIQGYHPLIASEFEQPLSFSMLPVRFYVFEDGIYIYAAHKDYQHLLGARLDKVGGYSALKALQKVSSMFPAENGMAVKAWGVYGLVMPEALNAFGIIESTEQAELTIELNGKTQQVSLPIIKHQPKELRGFVVDQAWKTIFSNQPLYLSNLTKPSWYSIVEKQKYIYLQINSFQSELLDQVLPDVERVAELLKQRKDYRLVLDIRFNPGGETDSINWVVQQLGATPANKEGSMFIITGRRTFSAAQLLATGLEQYTKAIFVGEPTGINIHFFANTRPNVILPNSELTIFLSTSWWQITNQSDSREWQKPQIETPLSFQDFVAGNDPALTEISRRLADK